MFKARAKMMKRSASAALSYSEWTREELIKRILELEPDKLARLSAQIPKPHDINIHEYPQAKIALKVYYNGADYHGFASSSGSPHSIDSLKMDTVEDHLFRAIYNTRLALPGTELHWSRAGRTDAGVSAIGQIVAGRLRISNKKGPESTQCTIDFPRVLNPQLPESIRVLGWTLVPNSFDARFDCKWREYKYFFLKSGLDILSMRKAAESLVGEHDFRNFCRKDKNNPTDNYRRRILRCLIEDIDSASCALVIRGTAFLYNQVRCIMAVLMMVGHGHENPDIVQELLHVENISKRPLYKIASDEHLVLYECGFEPQLIFNQCSLEALKDVFCKQSARVNSLLNIFKLALASLHLDLTHPIDETESKNGHLALKERPTEK
jgi:tRNA pseudouridine38/39 synthase